MFSATFDKNCRQLARKFLADDHVRVRIGRPGSTHINVDQTVRAMGPGYCDMTDRCRLSIPRPT